MKKSVFTILIFLIIIQTNGFCQKEMKRNMVKADTISADSLEYELIILDPGFDTWLATRPSKEFYSKDYYTQKNRLYVSEWNHRYMTSRNNGYDSYIIYDTRIDYGLDLNYKLYYYFRYFEETNKTDLLPGDRYHY
jgi:hypothetical protein